MPVTCHVDRQSTLLEDANIAVKHWQDLITFRNRQGTSRQEIVLHVNDDQRVALGWLDTSVASCRPCSNFAQMLRKFQHIADLINQYPRMFLVAQR